MPHAGSDAVFDFLRVCRHDVLFVFGVRPPTLPQGVPPKRLRALYARIQVASPPPSRVDKLPWDYGIRVNDGTEDGQPFQVAAGDNTWKQHGVFQVKGIPSLDQPAPDTILVDKWLKVAEAQDNPTTLTFTDKIDPRGFLSASYPQPELGDSGEAQVPVDYYVEDSLEWPHLLSPGSWLAISFDRFWPPERESVEYLAQVGDCDPPHDRASG
jgi:hypothetical protein